MNVLHRIAPISVIFMMMFGCSKSASDGSGPLLSEDLVGSTVDTFELDLDIAAVPETTGLPDTVTEANKYAWDMFAWQTFIAMNWPAVQPSSGNGYLRGYPDTTKNFTNVGSYSNTALVWETFKEKREMFKHDATTMEEAKPNPWSSTYTYGSEGIAPKGADQKRLFGTGKFATLDETVQVLAEARENYYDTAQAGAYKGMPTVARVFRGSAPDTGTSGPGNAVRYEVKVNYDFYKYVVDNGLYYDKAAYARSKQRPPIQLPWRTSLSNPGVSFYTQKPAETSYVQGYSIDSALNQFARGIADANGAPPPRIGAIHVKAAWAPITDAEKSQFLWREAEYFTGSDKDSETALFGLVGLHIIQRIKPNAASNLLNGSALGGTFIFSTWEHRDIRQDNADKKYALAQGDSLPTTQYTYTNYFGGNGGLPVVVSPPLDNPFFLSRLYPILDHTKEANAQVQAMVGKGSVWANYRLVGTQFKPVNLTTDATSTGSGLSVTDPITPVNPSGNDQQYEPIYLSNLVIETNLGLQQFQGQPPNLKGVAQFNAAVTATDTSIFTRITPQGGSKFGNLAYKASPINMGGCMGCHGVAQLNGYSFSFVLLGGQAGADPDSESTFLDPLATRNQNPAPVDILKSGVVINGINSTNFAGNITNTAGVAQRTTTVAPLTITAVDGRVSGSPFNFGDAVYISDASNNYLTATDQGTGVGTEKVVTFAATRSDASIWYLFDANNSTSRSAVLEPDSISFKNAAITINDTPAYLSSIGTTLPAAITTNSGPNVGASSYQLWNLALPQ